MGSASVAWQQAAPPYAAALTPRSGGWRSPLARDGRIPLVRPVVQIGRLEGNDVVLTDALASRHHARIRWTAQGYLLEDLGSANGTFAQGQRIAGGVLLAPGQSIRFGGTEMIFDVLPMPAWGGQPGTAPPVGQPQAVSAGAATVIGQPGMAPQAQQPQWPGQGQPGGVAGGGNTSMALSHPYYAQAAQRRENSFARIIQTEWRKRYWRVFVFGVLAYVVVAQVLYLTANLHLVPLVLLLASAVVPIVFVMFCWEQNALVDMPPAVVGITFLLGAVLGLTLAAVLEPAVLPESAAGTGQITLGQALIIGVVEETAKVVCIVWFLRDRRLRGELDGLILGAAAGMGFAALETAGYGFVAFLSAFFNALTSPQSQVSAIEAGAHLMNYQLVIRMALAIFGHGVWTAIVGAAIWRERRGATFRLTGGVLAAYAIAVVLHALWDWSPLVNLLPDGAGPVLALIVIFGWFLFIGALGLFILRFFLRESLALAKFGPQAPPVRPLLGALPRYFAHPFERLRIAPVYPPPGPSAAAPSGGTQGMAGDAAGGVRQP